MAWQISVAISLKVRFYKITQFFLRGLVYSAVFGKRDVFPIVIDYVSWWCVVSNYVHRFPILALSYSKTSFSGTLPDELGEVSYKCIENKSPSNTTEINSSAA